MAHDRFGHSVAQDEETVALGAIGDDGRGPDSGSVYVYSRSRGKWTLQSKLIPKDAAAGDWFGNSCDLEGDTLVVGSVHDDDLGGNSGSVYVYERVGSYWLESAKLNPSDGASAGRFGHDVSISGDRIVVGANGTRTGSAYVFARRHTEQTGAASWVEEGRLCPADPIALGKFGCAVAIETNCVVVGMSGGQASGANTGAAYVFRLRGSQWEQVAKLLAEDLAGGDNFGAAVALSQGTVLIGSPADDEFGASSGAAYLFEASVNRWRQTHKLLPSDGAPGAQFGASVGIRGSRLLVGASNDSTPILGAGSVYEFRLRSGSWLEASKFVAVDAEQSDSFGWDLDLGEDYFVAGAQNDDDLGSNSGSTYLTELRERFSPGTSRAQIDTNPALGDGLAPDQRTAFELVGDTD